MTFRLDHINLVVADLAASVHFYSGLFDMTVVLEAELAGPWFETVTGLAGAVADCVILKAAAPTAPAASGADGGFRIELLRFRAPCPDATGTKACVTPGPVGINSRPCTLGLRHFAVQVPDLEASLARARALGATGVPDRAAPGIAVVEVPRTLLPTGKRMCYLRDPDGVLVELAEYRGTPAAPDQRGAVRT